MKHPHWLWRPLPVLALFFIASCIFDGDSGDDPGAPPTELAAGDSISHVLPGENGAGTTGFTFHADSGSTYRLIVLDSASSFSLRVEDLDSNRQYTSNAQDFQKKSVRIDFPCTRSGEYRLVVTGPAGATATATMAATGGLPTSFVAPDAFEPDNTLHDAREIAADGVWNARTGASGLSGDVDWFNTRVRAGYTYSIEFHDSVVLYGTSKSLWTGDSSAVGYPSTAGLSHASFENGKIWFRADCTPGGVRYRVRVVETQGLPSGAALPDAGEPDDSLHPVPRQADSVLSARTLHGLTSSRDTDWISIPIDSGRTYFFGLWDTTASMSWSVSGVPEGISVASPYPTTVGKARYSTWNLPTATKGSILVKLHGYKAGGYAFAAWSKAGIPDSVKPEIGEPDSVPEQALRLPLDTVPVTRMIRGFDVDWIRFDPRPDQAFVLRIQNLSQDTALLWTASYDNSGRGTHWLAKGATESLTVYPKSQPLLVKIVGGNSLGGNRIRYGISTRSFAVVPDPLEPDDSRNVPKDIALGATFERWTVMNDSDCMRIPAGPNQLLRVLRSGPLGSPGYMGLGAWESDGKELSRLGDSTIGYARVTYFRGSGPITVCNEVTTSYALNYSIRIDTLSADPDEVSTSRSHPMPILSDSVEIDLTLPAGDTDWLSLSARKGTLYDFTLSSSDRILLSQGDKLIEPKAGPYEHYKWVAPADGDVLVALVGTRVFTTPVPPPTHLRVLAIPGDTLGGYADSSHPGQIRLDGVQMTRVFHPGIDLWMSATARAGWLYRYVAVPPPQVSVHLEITQGDSLASQGWLSGYTRIWRAPADGPFLMHFGNSSASGKTGPLLLTFEEIEDTSQNPHHDVAHAKRLPVDSTLLPQFSGASDTNYYSFPVIAGKSYTLRLDFEKDVSIYRMKGEGQEAEYIGYSDRRPGLRTYDLGVAESNGVWYVRLDCSLWSWSNYFRIGVTSD